MILNPLVVNLKEGIKRVQVRTKDDEEVMKMELGKSVRGRKTGQTTEVLKE